MAPTAEDKSDSKQQQRLEQRNRRRRTRDRVCHCCGKTAPFCWTCRCGFAICQECMNESVWGLSCNGITWNCPECDRQNGFGNQ